MISTLPNASLRIYDAQTVDAALKETPSPLVDVESCYVALNKAYGR
jgi:hypothetical protein